MKLGSSLALPTKEKKAATCTKPRADRGIFSAWHASAPSKRGRAAAPYFRTHTEIISFAADIDVAAGGGELHIWPAAVNLRDELGALLVELPVEIRINAPTHGAGFEIGGDFLGQR